MLKNLLTNKLYQFTLLYLILSYAFLSKEVHALTLVSGTTTCYKAGPNEVIENDKFTSYSLGYFVSVPAQFQKKSSGLLCLQTYLYDPNTGLKTTTRVWYRISDGDWEYDQQSDMAFRSKGDCTGPLPKYYSSVTNDYPSTEQICKDLDKINSLTSSIKVAKTVERGECRILEKVGNTKPLADEDVPISSLFNIGEWERCQCTTKDNSTQWSEVYYLDGQGNKTMYSSSKIFQNFDIYINDDNEPTWAIGSQQIKDLEEFKNSIIACQNNHKSNVYNQVSGGCYDSLNECQSVNCAEEDRDKYKINGVFKTYQEVIDAVNNGNIQPNATLDKCDCSIAYNINYTPLLCASNLPGANCNEVCKIVPAKLSQLKPIAPLSPLAFINVLANFLFWFAVILFIINFVTAGLEMVRSGDEPDKMKEATERITSSIFGFIFVLVASGLINYLIGFLNTYIQ